MDDHTTHAPTWVSRGEKIQVAGHNIEGGLVYITGDLSAENWLINASLDALAAEPDFKGEFIDFWPVYSQMPVQCRTAYLTWLAEGRTRANIHPAYVLLFLYGLERRLILENSQADAHAILTEIAQLSSSYRQHRSVRKVVRQIADAASLVLFGVLPQPDLSLLSGGDVVPISVKHALGSLASIGAPVPPNLLLAWVANDNSRNFALPDTEKLPAFSEFFFEHASRFRPSGIVLDADSAPRLCYTYRAACGAFEINFDRLTNNVPDITSMQAARLEAHSLVREALERFSKRPRRAEKIGASLNETATSPELATRAARDESINNQPAQHGPAVVQKWAREQLGTSPEISLRAALRRLRGMPPKRLVRSEIERLGVFLAQVGIGMVPDPRWDIEPPRLSEDAILFELSAPIDHAEIASEEYELALLLVMVCVSVARSDEDLAVQEMRFVDQLIDDLSSLGLTEIARLKTEHRWLQSRAVPLAPVLSAIGRFSDADKKKLGDLVIGTAMADGQFPEMEQHFVSAIFKAIELPEPRWVVRGEQISQHATAVHVAESEPVDRVLDVEFGDELPRSSDETVPNDADGADRSDVGDRIVTEGLNEKHAAFLSNLMQQVEWNRRALEQLARTHRLMPDGAIEAINEWAFDLYDDRLIDVEDDGYVRINNEAAIQIARAAA